MSAALPGVVLLPLAAATVSVLLRGRAAGAIGLAAAFTTLAAALVLVGQVAAEGSQRVTFGPPGFGLDLFADGIAAVLLATTAAVNAVVSAYAAGAYGALPGRRAASDQGATFWPRWLLLSSAMYLVFLSPNVFVLYVAFELVGVGAVALVVLDGSLDALTAGMRYLLAAFGGSVLYLVGVVILYADSGTLDLYAMSGLVTASPAAGGALALMTVGLLVTAALFPLHFWLPTAHALAPSSASPILSALVIKVSYYAVIVLWFQALPQVVTPAATVTIALLGAGAIVWGSLSALRQQHLKRLVAYSTVAQMGYLFIIPAMLLQVAPGATPETAAWYGWHGGVYYAVAHSTGKAAMLMAAGTLALGAGSDRLEALQGAAARLPVSTFAFAIAGISLVGLPPSGGFVGKWYLLTAALASGQWWIALVVLGGGGLTAGYLMLVLRRAFTPAAVDAGDPHPVPRTMELTALALAIVTVALGFRATEIVRLLEVGTPFPGIGG